MEFKSSGNSGGCSSRAKLLIVIELTRWISGGPFRRWPMGKGRGRVKNSLSSRLPRSLVGRADVRKSILKLIEAYRVINDEMTKRAPLSPPPPPEFDALYIPILISLTRSNRLCDLVKMVERFSSLVFFVPIK